MNTKKKDHLPLFGVGPLIVLPQVILTIIGVILVKRVFLLVGNLIYLRFQC